MGDELAGKRFEKLVEIMARTGDPRAVPTLVKAMQSPDVTVSRAAAGHLVWWFPGSPGVTEAFEQALQRSSRLQRCRAGVGALLLVLFAASDRRSGWSSLGWRLHRHCPCG